jgi:hypothetical protein
MRDKWNVIEKICCRKLEKLKKKKMREKQRGDGEEDDMGSGLERRVEPPITEIWELTEEVKRNFVRNRAFGECLRLDL